MFKRKKDKADEAGSFSDIVKQDLAEAIEEDRQKKTERERESDVKAVKALKELVSDEDEASGHTNVSLRTILGGDILAGRWFIKQFWYMVMIVLMCILYVSNRYYCQQEMLEGTRLADTLQDRRYKALTVSSQIKEMTRRSVVEQSLSDTALKTPTSPVYRLSVENEGEEMAPSAAPADTASATP